MGGYFLKKLASSILTLFFVALCTFLMGRAIPGGPFDSEKAQPAHIKKLQEEKYGFNKPPLVQFYRYAKDVLLKGDFGKSIKFVDRPVATIILETLPVSLWLGLVALIFSLVVGIPLGVVSALKPNSLWDAGSVFVSVSGVTIPSFIVAACLVLLFSETLGWFPPARLDEGYLSYVLPVITLGIRPAAIIARLVRASLMDQMSLDYVRTGRAVGLTEAKIARHMLRNSLLPMVTVLGPIAANILTGSFIVEHFFAISGLAKHFIMAVTNRDVYLMMGVTLVFASVLIVINLAVDLLYPYLDPRMASA
jgi:oligopeptide transport system permease protein